MEINNREEHVILERIKEMLMTKKMWNVLFYRSIYRLGGITEEVSKVIELVGAVKLNTVKREFNRYKRLKKMGFSDKDLMNCDNWRKYEKKGKGFADPRRKDRFKQKKRRYIL